MIIYNGPSLLDGKPIVVIALAKSSNIKTGSMVQTYIIRSDINPLKASKTGEDFSICGNCKLRGKANNDPKRKQAKDRACYVLLGQGPLNVFRTYKKGKYPEINGHKNIAAIGKNKMIRLGTYGDPSAVPSYIWDSLLTDAIGHTGYSHQANVDSADYRPDIVMRSADNLKEAIQAWDNGERTFRVVKGLDDIVKGKEILCPASKEAGQKVQCIQCKLCSGSKIKAKSIAIPAHGAGSKHLVA